MYYEHKKHDGSLPLVGVNTFLGGKESHVEGGELELMRSTEGEKDQQVGNVEGFRAAHGGEAASELVRLQQVARERGNTFEALVEAGKVCSLGSMSHALYDVGGEYRRNM
jgi:methylmalonyl-CoA mutase